MRWLLFIRQKASTMAGLATAEQHQMQTKKADQPIPTASPDAGQRLAVLRSDSAAAPI
ncbi:hypothetical protein N5O82_16695 [Stutzerimonas stutzeri]|uniref:hypothetical protein n=1 Tax=Stutzerimonas stutzeri TaxID=316 RepID=UPI002441CC1F|nr:hypothetical protein [Stutzerimonas stutzeri]WGG15708.1 hypothetical protein N5O82_16695 [Stutzerimonas stutzeri]